MIRFAGEQYLRKRLPVTGKSLAGPPVPLWVTDVSGLLLRLIFIHSPPPSLALFILRFLAMKIKNTMFFQGFSLPEYVHSQVLE